MLCYAIFYFFFHFSFCLFMFIAVAIAIPHLSYLMVICLCVSTIFIVWIKSYGVQILFLCHSCLMPIVTRCNGNKQCHLFANVYSTEFCFSLSFFWVYFRFFTLHSNCVSEASLHLSISVCSRTIPYDILLLHFFFGSRTQVCDSIWVSQCCYYICYPLLRHLFSNSFYFVVFSRSIISFGLSV